MSRDEVVFILLNRFAEDGPTARPEADVDTMAETLIDELSAHWNTMPSSTKAVLLGLTYDLKKHAAESRASAANSPSMGGLQDRWTRGLGA
ncbi:MAG: hypothetical protein V4625_19090 [Pseudomonadota bacterium]